MGRNRIKVFLEDHDRASLFASLDRMDLWKMAIVYTNGVCETLTEFPDEAHYKLDTKIKATALSISNNLVKGFKARTREEFERFLDDAVESIHATVAKLMIAKSWCYIDRHKALSLFDEGHALVKQIKRFNT